VRTVKILIAFFHLTPPKLNTLEAV